MFQRLSVLACLAFVLTLGTGCATLFGTPTDTLAISSEPPQAEVYVNGFRMGVTPLELALKPDKSYSIEYRKEGYQSVTRIVNTKVGAGWVILDVLGGLIPVVIDAATGNWNHLDQKAINAVLVEQN